MCILQNDTIWIIGWSNGTAFNEFWQFQFLFCVQSLGETHNKQKNINFLALWNSISVSLIISEKTSLSKCTANVFDNNEKRYHYTICAVLKTQKEMICLADENDSFSYHESNILMKL